MKIIIEINDEVAPQILQAVAAANGWPRDKVEDTVERINLYMLKTVGQWARSGAEIMMREQLEAETVETISKSVTITATL